jgi:hypothetical protein
VSETVVVTVMVRAGVGLATGWEVVTTGEEVAGLEADAAL